MKYPVLFYSLICLFLFFACSDNRAEELFETAEFEVLQSNRKHAEQLYRQIIKQYPESDYAGKAEDRLSALEQETE